MAIEVETGKSDIKANMTKLKTGGFDRLVLIATSPTAVTKCQKAVNELEKEQGAKVDLMTWIDIS